MNIESPLLSLLSRLAIVVIVNIIHLSSISTLPGAYPENQATIANINANMLPYAPRYAKEILGRKNRPDEQMRS